ncbi:MAG: hypothetical protein ACM34K_00565 [Bacillota bacterium]
MKHCRTLLISFILTVITLAIYSCKQSIPIEPEDTSVPGRRDYTWTIDTVYSPMNYFHAIWGSSPEDVWVCGPGGDGPEWVQHYDGSKWTPYTKNGGVYIGGNTLFGFSKDNIYLGGEGAYILHYDGNSWKGNYIYEIQGVHDRLITDIWGKRADDLYACGIFSEGVPSQDSENYKGFILHYDGQSWKEVVRADFKSQFLSIRKAGDRVYVLSFTRNCQDSYNSKVEFYELKGSQLSRIYSNAEGSITWASHHVIGDKIYFVIGKEIYRYNGSRLVKIISSSEKNFGYQCYGRSEKDMFIRMNDGVAHYNGTDIQYIYKFQDKSANITNEPLILDKDIFFTVWGTGKGRNMILHGRLKE